MDGTQSSGLTTEERTAASGLLKLVDASPSPYHAVAYVAARLAELGFTRLLEGDAWSIDAGGKHYVVRQDGTVVAFVVGTAAPHRAGFRLFGAHTDSPNLRLKPDAPTQKAGYLQLGVEIYGGVLLATWLDRDLSLAGRVVHMRDGKAETSLVDFEAPIGRVANLAIHLNRKVNTDGLTVNKQKHMVPMVGLGKERVDLNKELAHRLKTKADSIVGFDLCLYDTQRSSLGGLSEEFVYAPRLDNLGSCFTGLEAFVAAPTTDTTRVLALYDHEECGSRSAAGAQGTMLIDVLSRIAQGFPEAPADAMPRAIANSFMVSADMAHALHPNYTDKHDSQHAPKLNQGVVIKTNANQSYATSGVSAARFTAMCRRADATPQQFVVRSDMPCGSTIGPITAARLGIETVDVGAPMLSMHSCREMAGSRDVKTAIACYATLFDGS